MSSSSNPAQAGFHLLWEIIREDWHYQAAMLERALVLTYRLRHWGMTRSPGLLWRPLAILLLPFEFWVRTMISGQISARATIGRRIRIPHAWGIVIHPSAMIGDNCILYHQVTLGVNEHRNLHIGPHIGDNVYIGAGAKVIGAITVGDGSAIGANAVVIRDVPPGHVAVGVPAQARPRRDRTAPQTIPGDDHALPIQQEAP